LTLIELGGVPRPVAYVEAFKVESVQYLIQKVLLPPLPTDAMDNLGLPHRKNGREHGRKEKQAR
jgi:hypothetical protein